MKITKNKKGFELQNLYGFVLMLVMVGLLLGIGVLILDKFSTAIYLDKDVVNETITTPANQTGVSLARQNLTTFTSFINKSGVDYPTANYTVNLATGLLNITNNGTRVCVEGQECYVSYTWRDWGTAAVSALNDTRDSITPIASTWLALIVTIVVLAIILTIVIRSFAVKGR